LGFPALCRWLEHNRQKKGKDDTIASTPKGIQARLKQKEQEDDQKAKQETSKQKVPPLEEEWQKILEEKFYDMPVAKYAHNLARNSVQVHMAGLLTDR
jgi:hypothetical protein